MKPSVKVAFGAILTALSVILLFLGGITGTLDLAAAALASFCVIFAVIEMGYGSAFLVYAAASVLGILLPVKAPALFFAAFFGYYPLVKSLSEKLSLVISYVIKLAVYSVAYLVMIAFSLVVITEDIATGNKLILIYAALYLACAVILMIYDIALTRIITAYIGSLRKKLGMNRFRK